MIFFTVNTVIELICLLAALFFLWNDREPAWKIMIVYLAVICLTEFSGIYMKRVLVQPNFIVYNIYLPVECGVVSYFFYYLYRPYRNALKWLIVWLAVFLAMYSVEIRHAPGFVFISDAVMSLVFVLASMYFYYLMLKDEEFRQLWFYAPFWWVNGTLFYYFGGTACNIFFDYLVQPENRSNVRYVVYVSLDLLLYCSWTFAFICRYRQKISSSSLG